MNDFEEFVKQTQEIFKQTKSDHFPPKGTALLGHRLDFGLGPIEPYKALYRALQGPIGMP